jgi:membrane protein required for colicin V production
MNGFDYFIVGVALLSVLIGVWRGAVREVLHLAGWVLAFFLSWAYAGTLAPYFADWMNEPAFRTALAWLTIFLGVLVLSSLIASLVTELVRKFGLDSLPAGPSVLPAGHW